MNAKQLAEKMKLEIINLCDNGSELTKVFCCDLLSVAMSKAPAGCVWVTVMGNVNSIAVSSLTEGGCIILAEGTSLDNVSAEKAKEQEINVFRSDKPVFELAKEADRLLGNA